MKVVQLKPLWHRDMECMGIYFEINSRLQAELQKTGVVKFSRTKNCWWSPFSEENHQKISGALNGLAVIESSALRSWLAAKNRDNAPLPPGSGRQVVQSKLCNLQVYNLYEYNLRTGICPRKNR